MLEKGIKQIAKIAIAKKYLEENLFIRNLSLLCLNVLLVLLLVIQYNLGGFFVNDYDAASLLLDIKQEDVQSIHIEDADFKNASIVLKKKKLLLKEEWYSKEGSSSSKQQYAWEMEILEKKAKEGSSSIKYKADVQRVYEFFESLDTMRRYYSIPRTPEKEKSIGMQTNDKGEYAGLKIRLQKNKEKSIVLYVGRSVNRGRELYIAKDKEDKIYLVRSEIRRKSGSGELDYFRDRIFFPREMKDKEIETFLVSKNNQSFFHLVRKGKNWEMLSPPTSRKVAQSKVSQFLKDLLMWRISEFPSKLPENTNSNFALEINLTYKVKNVLQPKQFSFEILGKKGYNDYIIRFKDRPTDLFQISSIYMDDVYDPQKNFIEEASPIPRTTK